MVRSIVATLAFVLSALPASADVMEVAAAGTVSETADRLEAAIGDAGATVFARVNHGAGAASVDMDLTDAELVVFGNPRLGTPALQQDIHAGLVLPLRVLVYADDDGQTWLAYESVDAMFEDLEIAQDAGFRDVMAGALDRLTAAASGN